MSSLSVTVEVDGGTPIQVAAVEAVELATRLGVWVCFKFNDVACSAAPMGDAEELVAGYHSAIKPDVSYPMAFAHTRRFKMPSDDSNGDKAQEL